MHACIVAVRISSRSVHGRALIPTTDSCILPQVELMERFDNLFPWPFYRFEWKTFRGHLMCQVPPHLQVPFSNHLKDVLLFVCAFFIFLLWAGNTHGVLILVPRKEHAQPPPAYGEPQVRLQLILQTSIRNKGVSHSLPLIFDLFCEEVL